MAQFLACILLIQLGITTLISAHPSFANFAQVKRSVQELNEYYDYIIVGGGTAGLTVANRLTEDSSKNVLVVELGYFGDEPCIWMPPTSVSRGTGLSCNRHRFNYTIIPQPGINNATSIYPAGAVVGGSSAVNGMVFDRGAQADYDAWEQLGNTGWGWKGLFEYFKKSSKFTPPKEETVERWGMTWDQAAYGDGPIQATFSNFQWKTNEPMWKAWGDLNITGPKDHALGNAVGAFWMPASQHPVNQTRSYARYGYHDPIKDRINYHLLIGYKAAKLVLSSNNTVEGVIIHHRDTPNEQHTFKATKEYILAAGSIHTPQILELSGIGRKEVLEAAGIQQKVFAPGVGENLQDHPQAKFVCNFTNDFWPNQGTLGSNATFAAAALEEYNTNKSGPLTLSLSNAAAFLPFNTTHSSPSSFFAKLAAQAPDAFLPPNLPPPLIAGYAYQKKVLTDLYSRSDAAVYETPFNGVCSRTLILQKPLSRGSIHINATDPTGPPIIDVAVYKNPLDLENAIEFVKFTRRYINSPSLAPLRPVETGPGPNITDTAAIEAHVRATSGPTSFHVCGVAAMLPKTLGGVVGTDLKVYGVQGLSIVDASIIPLIPSTHLSATVYAIAEKAADIIKARHKSG